MFYGCHIWSQEQLKLWLWSQRSKKGRISQNTDVTCDCVQICFRSSFFFFCQHFSDLYLGHDLTDFDQTWSQVPGDHPIYVTWPDYGQRSRRGHRGLKGHFHWKRFSSYKLRSMIVWHMYMIELETLYKSYAIRVWSKVIWGHRGQK